MKKRKNKLNSFNENKKSPNKREKYIAKEEKALKILIFLAPVFFALLLILYFPFSNSYINLNLVIILITFIFYVAWEIYFIKFVKQLKEKEYLDWIYGKDFKIFQLILIIIIIVSGYFIFFIESAKNNFFTIFSTTLLIIYIFIFLYFYKKVNSLKNKK